MHTPEQTEVLVKELLGYIMEGKNVDAERALYADDVVSFEQNGVHAKGLEAVIAKTEGSMTYFEAFHGIKVEPVFVGAGNFLLIFNMDVTPKGGERVHIVEYGFYKLNEDGKVSEEYFYATPMAA